MRPTRRQFAQGMAAGLAGLALPPAVASSAVAAPQGPNPRSGRGLDERAIQAALDAVARRFPTAAVRPASLLGRREARADARRDAPRPGTGGPDRE